MLTAGTYGKSRLFNTPGKLDILQDAIFKYANEYGWDLQAWAMLENHYHLVALSQKEPETLKNFVSDVHRTTTTTLNEIDDTPKRKVWFQYWDSHITYQKSYFARLKYVTCNPVRHGITRNPEKYKWCSALWFARTADRPFHDTVMSFGTERINVKDDF